MLTQVCSKTAPSTVQSSLGHTETYERWEEEIIELTKEKLKMSLWERNLYQYLDFVN